MKTYLLKAKGAVSVPISGSARGLMLSASASHFGTIGSNPGFTAHYLNNGISAAVCQPKPDVPALALNTWSRIGGASYKPDQRLVFHTRSNHAP